MPDSIGSMIVLVLAITWKSAVSQSACFLKCKDNYMNGMDNEMRAVTNEWSIEMATPLQPLLLSETSTDRLAKKMLRICRMNREYSDCLHRCGDGVAKEILRQGQTAWDVICDHLHTNQGFRRNTIACWAHNGRQIVEKCSPLATALQSETVELMKNGIPGITEGLDHFCRSIHAYDKCFVYQNSQMCGDEAVSFVLSLTHRTSHALIDLLDQTLGPVHLEPLPKACKKWLNHEGMRGLDRARASLRSLRESSAWTPPLLLSLLVTLLW